MKVITLHDVLDKEKNQCIAAIKSGEIFIYPTDTVYGIGCNMENSISVKKIYAAKNKPETKPFSIIVPSVEWLEKNCILSDTTKKFIGSLLPGPYTIIVRLRNKSGLFPTQTVGVRIPKHPFTDLAREAGVLFVTTSVNVSGEAPIKAIKEIPGQIKSAVDWIIDAGELSGEASRIFDLTTDQIKIVRR